MPDQPLTPRERAEQIASKFLEYVHGLNENPSERLTSWIESAILEEREACAKLLESKAENTLVGHKATYWTLFSAAKFIRSRTPHVPQQEGGEER